MTRRERLEAKLEKRREWAASREAKSTRAFNTARQLVEGIPLGQPILIGHHSEKRHRAVIDRMGAQMDKGVEHSKMAEHHESKAHGLENALDSSIFSDDPDAVEALEARIAALESERELHRTVGAAWRKNKKPSATDAEAWARIKTACGLTDQQALKYRTDCAFEEQFLKRGPVPSYVLSNLGGNISRLKKRLEAVKIRQQRQGRADAAPAGVLIETRGEYAQITFAEKPERAVIEALKSASFHWSSGSWFGKPADIPACVQELVS